MTSSVTRSKIRILVLLAAAVVAVVLAVIVAQQIAATFSSAAVAANGEILPTGKTSGDPAGELTAEDGLLPASATIHDEQYPGIANLDAELRGAAQAAADAAGISFQVNSGWRSQRYQEQLIAGGVEEYGSVEEAARWIGTPTGSRHVTGEAIDVDWEASDWLAQHGADYGLCQTYQNEAWHFELRPDAPEAGCPVGYADAAHDPRMER